MSNLQLETVPNKSSARLPLLNGYTEKHLVQHDKQTNIPGIIASWFSVLEAHFISLKI